eukprot:8551830-Pyramimonas_sp.AAC.1
MVHRFARKQIRFDGDPRLTGASEGKVYMCMCVWHTRCSERVTPRRPSPRPLSTFFQSLHRRAISYSATP